jgi:pyridoxine 5-phosphate synthase
VRGEAPNPNTILERNRVGAPQATRLGLEVNAGNGLDNVTAERISEISEIVELNIGHFLVGEALFSGLDQVIRTFRGAMERGRARAQGKAA